MLNASCNTIADECLTMSRTVYTPPLMNLDRLSLTADLSKALQQIAANIRYQCCELRLACARDLTHSVLETAALAPECTQSRACALTKTVWPARVQQL